MIVNCSEGIIRFLNQKYSREYTAVKTIKIGIEYIKICSEKVNKDERIIAHINIIIAKV